VYIHKAKGGKYTMGPIWDFDWGFGMDEDSRKYFNIVDVPLLRENDVRKGSAFFKNFLKDSEIRKIYIEQWEEYRLRKFDELMLYIEAYAALIRESQKKDYEVWQVGVNNLPQYKADLKTYLRKRASLMDANVAKLKLAL
jgi:hypothetical protein